MNTNSSDIILRNLLDGILIVNNQGKIIFLNKAAENLFSKSLNELLGQNFGFPVTPAEVQEIEIVRDNKIRTVQMLATGIRWYDQDACLLSLRDITELKNVSKQLEARTSKLEKSNQELEQYASLASHDLKEPVRKVLIFTGRLLNNTSSLSKAELNVQLRKIYDSAERMKCLINGIAEFSQLSGNEQNFEPVDLNDVVKEIMTDLELLIAEKNAEVHISNLSTIEAIRIQMHQLFLNILSNSLKYAKKDIPPEITIRQTDLDSQIEITISDNGIGFDNNYAEKVFKPFQRLHLKEYDGSGIGLAICRKIVEAHGGEIGARSIPGDGSHFTFTLEKQHFQ